ncbi:hypothetical protein KP509_02G021400 [Ceratopteris richardii]|uniref:Cytochrome P450 n=1 Tax=Ceratopteris richardii TaxID=49495 RepID=A0A8T2VB04_CERRI|nr:hypothetical protein KP509_02G021400 [Ceratopteris richardii]KAH7443136.1 hypothetical protein KP509_02G021400 [Ceratopteris richardii]
MFTLPLRNRKPPGTRCSQQGSPVSTFAEHKTRPQISKFQLSAFQLYSCTGDKFIFWQGAQARFFLTDPDDVKEVLCSRSTQISRLQRRPDMVNLVDNGLLQLEGEDWAFHRRTLNPGFLPDKLKKMVPIMAGCTMEMIEKWSSKEANEAKRHEIDVFTELKKLTADIIAHTAFGSSYAEAKQIFELQQEQLRLAKQIGSKPCIPGLRFIPTAFHRHCWKVEKKIEELTSEMIERRIRQRKLNQKDMHGDDLLGLMIDAMDNRALGLDKKLSMGIADIVGETKTFFMAGHETTATSISWTLMLLAAYPEWQARVRDEARTVCDASSVPAPGSLHRLNLLSIVLNESLRLYPPGALMTRMANKDIRVGKTLVPKGTVLVLPIIAFHHDQRYWGPDANEFRPERFSEGASKASQSSSPVFLTFSAGPQFCIGQLFALQEAKVVIASILLRYRIMVSPRYRHSPINYTILQPQFGVPLLFESI